MGRWVISLIACTVWAIAADSWATTFDLHNLGTNLPSPLNLTVDGVTLQLSNGLFNSLSDSFGIDSNFLTPDNPNLIDISETLFFTFDQAVYLDSVTISQYDSQDSGQLLLKAAGVTTPLVNGVMSVGGILLEKNGSDRINSLMGTATGGTRGFSVDSLVVRAVPEPSSLCLVWIALAAMQFGTRLRA